MHSFEGRTVGAASRPFGGCTAMRSVERQAREVIRTAADACFDETTALQRAVV